MKDVEKSEEKKTLRHPRKAYFMLSRHKPSPLKYRASVKRSAHQVPTLDGFAGGTRGINK
jgi:hypothetical protein